VIAASRPVETRERVARFLQYPEWIAAGYLYREKSG